MADYSEMTTDKAYHVYECPMCYEETDKEGLLCMDCAIAKGEAADHADLINRCDW